MEIDKAKFEKWVEETIESLPEKYLTHMNNVAIFVEDYPTPQQLGRMRLRRGAVLFGLYEGYHQALKLNIGPVLPDRITIFRKSITNFYDNEEDVKKQIRNTVRHEIAHHFGSDEWGAAKAARRK